MEYTEGRIREIESAIREVELRAAKPRRLVFAAEDEIDGLRAELKTELDRLSEGSPFEKMISGEVPIHRVDQRVTAAFFDKKRPTFKSNPDMRFQVPSETIIMNAVEQSQDRSRTLAVMLLSGSQSPFSQPFIGRADREKQRMDRMMRADPSSFDKEKIDIARSQDRTGSRSSIENCIPKEMSRSDLVKTAEILYREAGVRVTTEPWSRTDLVEVGLGGLLSSWDGLQGRDEIEEFFSARRARGLEETFYLGLSAGRIIKSLQSVAVYDWEKLGRAPTIYDMFSHQYFYGLGDPAQCVSGIEDSTKATKSQSNKKRARQREDLVEALGDKCNVCKRFAGVVVDHDHPSDLVRGFLCQSCNKKAGKSCVHSGVAPTEGFHCEMGSYLDNPPAFSVDMRDPLYGGHRLFMRSIENRLDDMESAAKSAPELSYILPMIEKLRRGEPLSAEETLYSPLRG